MPTGGTWLHLNIKQNHPAFRCLQVTAATRAGTVKGMEKKREIKRPEERIERFGGACSRMRLLSWPAELCRTGEDNDAASSATN